MNRELLNIVCAILRNIVYEPHCSAARRQLCYHIMSHISGYEGTATYIQ